MNCPWCEFSGSPRELHAHLGTSHPEAVSFEGTGSRRRYSVTCPYCDAGYQQAIKPGLDAPEFLEEYCQEVRLVAFDMLVNHILVEHDEDVAQRQRSEVGAAESTADITPGSQAHRR